jgi:5-methylcytosine-specific restriction protein A
MQKVVCLVFRELTDADFFNINKPPRMERRGGGQSYIDVSTNAVTLSNWRELLKGTNERAGIHGPIWQPLVRSLGASSNGPQKVKIAQRRTASVAIRSQKLGSRESNRVLAWRPDLTRFPKPMNPSVREHINNLHVYIARLENGELWAGWFQASQPALEWSTNSELNRMFTGSEGFIRFQAPVLFDFAAPAWPFKVGGYSGQHEEEQEALLFIEDEAASGDEPTEFRETIRKIRVRNAKAVRTLKALYKNRCQISGDKYAFKKVDGEFYSEAHHLVPLGRGGADSVYNIVVVSPLLHRMLHLARVEGLDLSRIQDNMLFIRINDQEYVVTWHPEHGKIVKEFS